MLKKSLDLVPLVATAALTVSLLDRLLTGVPFHKEPIAYSSMALPGQVGGGSGAADGNGTIPGRSIPPFLRDLDVTCPNDRHARELVAIALRQLEGRHWIGASGHFYLNVANHAHRALLLRAFPGSMGFSESWSWLAEIANFHGPEVWSSSRDITPAERREGIEWRGGFLLLRRVLDPVSFQPRTTFRLFSYANRSWDRWRPGMVTVAADACRKNGRWYLQWRLEAEAGRFLLGNDPSANSEHAPLFGEPFFLLPVASRDIP